MIGALDLSTVNWAFVGLMMLLAFITALLGSLIAFRNRFAGAIIAAVLFGVGFVGTVRRLVDLSIDPAMPSGLVGAGMERS